MKSKGLTLMEIVISVGIIAFMAVTVLSAFPVLFEGLNISSQKVVAWEIAKREMETLKGTNFDTLFALAYDPQAQQPVANSFVTTGFLPQSSGVYYVEKMSDTGNQPLSDLIKVEVVVCLKAGQRVIGEDSNLNAVLDSGEDKNDDKKINSPVVLSTIIMKI
jgi:hypothetical protein